MSAAGFEPARISPCELESHALDHSATLTDTLAGVPTRSVGIRHYERRNEVTKSKLLKKNVKIKRTQICTRREIENVYEVRPMGYRT